VLVCIKKYFIKIIGILFCLVFQAGMASCNGLDIYFTQNIGPDTVKINFHKSGVYFDSIITYEYGPKGFSLGTGVQGQLIFENPHADLYCINLDQNVEYELYLCGEYTYTFAGVMTFGCFKDDFEGTDGLYAGWKTIDPLPGGRFGYTYAWINSNAYGNESHYLQIQTSSPTWQSSASQYMELVSPEINSLKQGEWVLLEFDVAGQGYDNAYGYTVENPYVPELELYLRSRGVIDYHFLTNQPVINDKLIGTLSSIPHKTFVHYVIWLKPILDYSSIVFKLTHSMGAILLDNVEISNGSNFCWVDVFNEGELELRERVIVVDNMDADELDNKQEEKGLLNSELVILSPNPAENEVHLAFEENQEAVEVRLFTVRGRLVFNGHYSHQEGITIDLEDLAPAFYIVQITTEKGQIIKHLIKK